MKILFVIPNIIAGTGGAQRVVSVLGSELVTQGHTVRFLIYKNIEGNNYPISDLIRIVDITENNNNKKKWRRYLGKLALLRKSVCDFEPDVIAPFLLSSMLYINLATVCSRYRKVTLATVRNNFWEFNRLDIRLGYYFSVLLGKAVYFQNNAQKSRFPRCVQRKAFVLPNPVADIFTSCRRDYGEITKLIAVGRLHHQKNYDMLIRAMALVVKVAPSICLDIYGEGVERACLLELIDSLKLKEQVRLCGTTLNVMQELSAHELFIMTSQYEGMPNALMEAMATGLPCIATNCPTGPSDLICNGENGILIPCNDIESCAAEIIKMIRHPEYAERLGRAARSTIIQHYSSEKIAERFATLCHKYLEIG